MKVFEHFTFPSISWYINNDFFLIFNFRVSDRISSLYTLEIKFRVHASTMKGSFHLVVESVFYCDCGRGSSRAGDEIVCSFFWTLDDLIIAVDSINMIIMRTWAFLVMPVEVAV